MESCKTCTKEKWQTNRCSGLLASSLCGTSVAPGKEMEHLGRHAETPRPYGPMIARVARLFMLLLSLNIHQLPTGETVMEARQSTGLWWMDPFCELSGLPSTRARPATAWGSLWERCACCPWGAGHPDTGDWLPQAEPVQALVLESDVWPLLLLPVRVPSTFMVKYGWASVLTAQVYPSRTRQNKPWEVS